MDGSAPSQTGTHPAIRVLICLAAAAIIIVPPPYPTVLRAGLPSSLAAAQRPSLCAPSDEVCADFSWQVADRFTPVWRSWRTSGNRGAYERSALAEPFLLTFDACRSWGTTPITSYAWVLRRLDVPGPPQRRTAGACRLDLPVPAEGAYVAALTVTTQNGQTATTVQRVILRDWLIVSLGDSYASGEGNPDVPRGPSTVGEWHDRRCHRSQISGPAQAALELERRDPQSTVTFLSYACSGARIRRGLIGNYGGLVPQRPPIPPQIEAAAGLLCGDDVCDRPGDPTIDVLLISIGGNDVGFSAAILACAGRLEDMADRTMEEFIRIDFLPRTDCPRQPGLTRLLEDRFRELPGLYETLRREIRRRLKVAAVYITEYPVDLFDSGPGCGSLELVTAAEGRWLASQGRRLNQIIHDSWRPVWTLVGMDLWRRDRRWDVISGIASAFEGHGYCAAASYYGRLGESIGKQLDYLGLLHPNAEGHRVYRDAILRRLDGAAEEVIRFPPRRVTITFEAVRVSPVASPADRTDVRLRVGRQIRMGGQVIPANQWTPLPAGRGAFSVEVSHPDDRIDILVSAKVLGRRESREVSLHLSLDLDGSFGAGGSRQATSTSQNNLSLSVRYRVDVAEMR